MVRLTRITTKGGDGGQTSLGDGSRVPKHAPRVAAYGDVDELNAALGLAQMELERGGGAPESSLRLREQLTRLQNDLFDVGADLCVPGAAGERLRIPEEHVSRLEEWISTWNAELTPLESFVLPAGPPATCHLHLARTICRRAERSVCALRDQPDDSDGINPRVVVYLNRLSDLLFVMARASAGPGERLWKPGG
jgi:cob(I)alamin adenosyltransferase